MKIKSIRYIDYDFKGERDNLFISISKMADDDYNKEYDKKEFEIFNEATKPGKNNYITNNIKKQFYKEMLIYAHSINMNEHYEIVHGDEKYQKNIEYFTDKMYDYIYSIVNRFDDYDPSNNIREQFSYVSEIVKILYSLYSFSLGCGCGCGK